MTGPKTIGQEIRESVKKSKARKNHTLFQVCEHLTQDISRGEWKANYLFINIMSNSDKALVNIDRDDIKMTIRWIDRKYVRCRIMQKSARVLDMVQAGDMAMAREVLMHMLKFLTQNAHFGTVYIRTECDAFNPTWKHIGKVNIKTKKIAFYGKEKQVVQEPMFLRWMHLFAPGYEAPLMGCDEDHAAFYPFESRRMGMKVIMPSTTDWFRNFEENRANNNVSDELEKPSTPLPLPAVGELI